MLFKPNEITNLKKGRYVLVEIKEGDVRVLKRNFCGVYELYCEEDSRSVEYFEDLNLFKNRYGTVHKRFPLYNLSRQRLDVYPVVKEMDGKEILKWFGDYGKIVYINTTRFDGLKIDYYTWISDMENTISKFQIVNDGDNVSLNIAAKNELRKIRKAV